MKTISILFVMCLLGTLSLEAQKTPVPAFKTVQVRPGIIKVPSFSLRAGTATRPDLKAISSSDLKAVTEIAPGTLVGTMEVSTTATKMNIELTPKNFISVNGAELIIQLPMYIYDKFIMGDNNDSRYSCIASLQSVIIGFDVTSGKQYLIRIPVTVEGSAARSFLISGANAISYSYINLFTTTFSGSQEIAFTLTTPNTGKIYILFYALPAAGGWSFSKIIISEL